jgi:hypothetical protein
LPGFAPAGEALLFRQNDPKPMTPHPATLDGMDARESADQLAALRQGPPVDMSVQPEAERKASERGRLDAV